MPRACGVKRQHRGEELAERLKSAEYMALTKMIERRLQLQEAKIRGVDSYSMICSEKELGITDESEGIILLDDDAPVGMPLTDYIGDAVLDISILANMARNANIIGVARELAAMLGRELKKSSNQLSVTSGQSVKELVEIEITNPELNPGFVAGLIRNVEIKPSPYQIQRRLKLAGVRPCIPAWKAGVYLSTPMLGEYGVP